MRLVVLIVLAMLVFPATAMAEHINRVTTTSSHRTVKRGELQHITVRTYPVVADRIQVTVLRRTATGWRKIRKYTRWSWNVWRVNYKAKVKGVYKTRTTAQLVLFTDDYYEIIESVSGASTYWRVK